MNSKLIYHAPSNLNDISPFDEAILRVSEGCSIKIISPYIGLSYLHRLIEVCTEWKLISDIEAWMSSLPRTERHKTWDFVQSNISMIHHYPAVHAKSVISLTKAYLGSSNLTAAGILGRTEIGILLDDSGSVSELNKWFDELWKLSTPPNIQEGSIYLQKLEQQPISFKPTGNSFSSPALQIKAKLAYRKHNDITDESNFAHDQFPTTQAEIFTIIPRTKLDDYIYRVILSFDFSNEKYVPESSHIEMLTQIPKAEQDLIFKAILNAGLIISNQENIPKFKLNEDFEWDINFTQLGKANSLWEHKAARLGRSVKLPRDMVIIPAPTKHAAHSSISSEKASNTTDSHNDQVNETLIELTPGEDHSYPSNLAFADSIYACLCNHLAHNGGMLMFPEPTALLFRQYNLGLLNPVSKIIYDDKSLDTSKVSMSTISYVLDEIVDGLPPSPFNIFLTVGEDLYLYKAMGEKLGKYPIRRIQV